MPASRTVVVGGGFGGLYCVRALRHTEVDITLIDRRNFHLFQPLLYQVATASLSPGDIATPLRNVLRHQRNVRVWLGDVVNVDVDDRSALMADGTRIGYDHLVIATGANHAYFGHPEWESRAPGLKTVEDAFEIRRRFLAAFEAAEREEDPETRRRLGTFVIVGAGPTGVELAGAMAEIARKNLPKEFRRIDTRNTRVVLVEAAERVLPGYPVSLSASAQRQLEALGVEVRTGTFVTGIHSDSIMAGDERIPARNVFWAAGVEASPLGAKLGVPLDKAGCVVVEPDCSVPGHPEVFVIGDLAHATDDGQQVPAVAQGAMQMGRHVARMIRADLDGSPRSPFHYRDKGNLATIGRARAVADMGRLRISGFIAWLLWAFIHIFYLIGFRNRILVMTQWAWAYFTSQRGVRLITGQWHTRSALMPIVAAGMVAMTGCGRDDRGRAQIDQTPNPVASDSTAPTGPGSEVTTVYAPELGIDLAAMAAAPSGLYMRDLELGPDDRTAAAGQRVSVEYTGWLANGVEFDSSQDSPITFELGAGEVIPGWDEGITGMRAGGRRILVIPPALAYGERGRAGVIPPNSTLVFDVRLVAITDTATAAADTSGRD